MSYRRLLIALPLLVCLSSPASAQPMGWLREAFDDLRQKFTPHTLSVQEMNTTDEVYDPIIYENATGAYLAAKHAQTNQDWVTALRYYKQARDLGLPPTAAHDMQFMLLAVGADRFDLGYALADTILQRGDKLSPHEEQLINLIKATGLLDNEDANAALAQMEKTRQSSLSSLIAPILTDWLRVISGEPIRPSGNGANLLRLLHLAMAYEATDNHDKAFNSYQRVLALQPNERATYIVVSYYLRQGETDKATALLEGVVANDQPDLTAIEWLEKLKAGQSPKLDAFSNHLTLKHGGYAAALQDFARLIYSEGGYDSALIFARLAQKIAPDLQGLQLTIGNILDKKGQHTQALHYFTQVDEKDPDALQAQIRAADMLSLLGREDEAIATLNKAQKQFKDARLLYALAEAYRTQEQYEQAIALYNEIENNHDMSKGQLWSVYYVRGITYDTLDQWDKAEADFKTALSYSPENPHILNYLGYSWVDRGLNLTEALELLQKAVQLAPQDGYIADSLGWALYKLGQYEKALPHLEFAISLQPGDPIINDHLGDLYWRLGRETEAEFQWLRAKDLYDPIVDSVALDETINKIANGLQGE